MKHTIGRFVLCIAFTWAIAYFGREIYKAWREEDPPHIFHVGDIVRLKSSGQRGQVAGLYQSGGNLVRVNATDEVRLADFEVEKWAD